MDLESEIDTTPFHPVVAIDHAWRRSRIGERARRPRPAIALIHVLITLFCRCLTGGGSQPFAVTKHDRAFLRHRNGSGCGREPEPAQGAGEHYAEKISHAAPSIAMMTNRPMVPPLSKRPQWALGEGPAAGRSAGSLQRLRTGPHGPT